MTDDESEMSFGPAAAIDKVRASKAGHAFHEAWAARSALELLLPSTDLVALTLEGFDAADESDLGTGAVEVADLVRYYGNSDVARATRVEIVQFKYSIASAAIPVRAADLVKTLRKFADADAQLRVRHGDELVGRVVRYDFATNRPIHDNLVAAIAASIDDTVSTGDIAKQKTQIADALEAYPYPHVDLLRRLALSGGRGTLKQADRAVGQILASWSETSDPEAEKQLLKLRNLVRIKAGPAGNGDNRIDRVAVLAELEIDHEDRLYPTPDAFPPVERLIERPIVDQAAALARDSGAPLIVHGAGGMGKTVLMQSLAERMCQRDQVVIFDGFGAGRWRDLADGRHRPERTLVHLANLLAGLGLCDILLPISDITSLLRGFRQRLAQAVATVRQADDTAGVVLILDAIDHAAIAAEETGTMSFAHVLLRSISVDPIEGVIVVASCRTERLEQAVGDSEYRGFEIPPFTAEEATALILANDASANAAEIAALQMRSGLNPRCLDTLLADGRPYDPVSAPDVEGGTPSDVLDALLRTRLENARRAARNKGTDDADIDLLLTALAVLPPPVPLDELAAAHGIALAKVESFAADLSPLLERTAYGLMFRDEPTETLIRTESSSDLAGRERVIATLFSRQSESNYAARALPALLTSLRYIDQLITLAFSERVPPGTSKVSQRDIRLSRITGALDMCAKSNRRDDLLRLLLEASIVAAGHERSDRFLYEFPDLAAVAGDAEALRRLFSTKAGWPGGRHSALALAYSFVGDMGEARRNARRAIDWHNWAASTPSRSTFKPGKASTRWDDIGFAYVEMLAGNDIRVAQFYASRGDNDAYEKFYDLFDLLERKKASHNPPSDEIARRLPRCRSRSRALWAAALQFSTREPESDRRLIRRFAAANATTENPNALPIASLAAAARAVDLGMVAEARTILATAAIPAPNIYGYSSYWAEDRDADIAVVAAGLGAVLTGRPVALVDLAPTELLALVSPSMRARGAAAFAKALGEKLADPHHLNGVSRNRRRKASLDYERRSEYQKALTHRIAPLIPYAQAIRDIVLPPSGRTRKDVLNAALDLLEREVGQESNYPYRDGKSYRARTGFHALFLIADVLGAIDRAVGNRLVDWLMTAPGMYAPQLTAVITRLSRVGECHDAALKLASHVEKLILVDTDISSRVSAYGELARAVWRVSTDESAAFFRRTLDLADAIGSDDFDRTNHLLELTSHYVGPELSAPAGHNLARILELNQSEDSKFPWFEYAQSMVPVTGLGILAMIARLDDRDKSDLGLSLGPALTILVTSGKLKADLACCLFGSVAPIETWAWRSTNFVKAVLDKLAPDQREWFFGLMLVEIDRGDQLSPWRETIERLLELARSHLATTSPALARVAALAARCGPEERSAFTSMEERVPPTYETDLADPEAIDRAILSEEIGPSGRRWPQRTIADLALSATAMAPAKRLAFVKAVVNANAASLADKLSALEDYLPAWSALSAALKDALPQLALTLAAKHASELARSDSNGWASWRDLDKYFGADRSVMVEQVISSLCATASEISGDSWLALAAKLAPVASAAALSEGLERFLALSGATLPAEVGDGPWNVCFAVSGDEVDVAAGLIWSRLGHSKAAMRWRGAHAVLRLAEVERFDVIDQLVARFDARTALPFGDAKLPFYPMHARLWLLIALARLAKDRSSQIAPYRPLLERVAFSSDFPHVVMRAFAIDALRLIAPLLDSPTRDNLLSRLEGANQSPFLQQPSDSFAEGRYIPRPDDYPRPDDAFHVDYDFNKYQTERLCHVFGCAGWEVEDGITRWVRRWDTSIQSMYNCPRSSRDNDSSWSSGSVPAIDRYGGYLGWHALMLVAGEMLQSRIVTVHDWKGDAWAHFLAEYRLSRPDGRWLSEATDLFPLDLTKEKDLPMPEVGMKGDDRKDHGLLAPLLGVADGKLSSDWMPVTGRWSLPNNADLTLRTVLAERDDARATMMTVLTDEKFFRWLPDDDDEIARHFGSEGHSVRAWIDTVKNSERRIDHHDPYATSTAMQRPFPAAWVRELLKLRADNPIVRTWSDLNGPAFRAEAWGAAGGRGENSWDNSGERITITRGRLLALLQVMNLVLVGVLKVQRYHKGKSSGRFGDTSPFTYRSYVFIVDQDGRVLA